MNINIRGLAVMVALAGIALLANTGTAWAQEDGGIGLGLPRLKVSVGAFQPSDGATRARNSDDWTLLSLSYSLQGPSRSRNTNFAAYIEGGQGTGDTRGRFGLDHELTRGFVGAGISTTVQLTRPNHHFGIYALAGAGGYLLQRQESEDIPEGHDIPSRSYCIDSNPIDDPSGDDQSTDDSDSFTLSSEQRLNAGYKLGGGVHFGRGFSVEAAYFNLGRLNRDSYSGVGLTIGMRL